MLDSQEQELIREFVEKQMEGIIHMQESKGLKASGESAQMLRVNLENNIAQLIDGAGYFEFEEFGRGAGKAPPVQKIYEWLAFKKYGLDYEQVSTGEALRGVTADKKRHSLAWAIMKKIQKKGTHTHINGHPTGVLSEVINQSALQELMSKIALKKSSEIRTDISRLNLNS
jgi:hypothetical protein